MGFEYHNEFFDELYYIDDDDVSSFNEAYIGKTPTLLEAEKQIGIIRESIDDFKDCNKLPCVLAFNRLMEKQFGMEVFALNIDQSNTVNAWTMPLGIRFDIALKMNASKLVTGSTKDGFKPAFSKT